MKDGYFNLSDSKRMMRMRFRSLGKNLILGFVALFLYAHSVEAQSTVTANPTNNNGSAAVTFNFVNNNAFDIIITDVASITGTTGANNATLWYKPGALTAAPGTISTANGWSSTTTQPFVGTLNTTTTTAQPMLTGLSVNVPAGQTYAMCFTLTSSLRYSTLTAGSYSYPGGGCTILEGTDIGWGGTFPSPNINNRGFIGTISFIAAVPCTAPPTAGSINAAANPVCPNVNSNLSLSGGTGGTGQTYQWLSSSSATGPWTPIAGATNSSYVANQSVNTYYRCAVTCTAMSDTTAAFLLQTNSFLNCYCTSNATSIADEEIVGIHIGTLSNTSTCTTTGGPGSITQQYSDYTQTVAAPALARSVGYPMTVDVGTCGTGSYNNMTKVFIDWNQNGLFTDAGEQVYVSPTYTSGAHQESFLVNVPVGAALGLTRMRIVTVETTVATGVNPCGTYTWGETEDYLVEIFPIPTCPQPTGLAVLGTTTSTASLDWTAGGSETVWQLQYGPQGFALGTGTIITVSTASDTVIGSLTSYSFYDVYVRGICGAGDTSFWAPKKTFNTYGLGYYMEMDLKCHPDGFIDISQTGAADPLVADGETGFALPFPFYFQGTEVNQITIGNNGAIVFNTISAQISPTNANTIASSAVPGLYPLWDDLEDAAGNVYWEEQGVAPNRRFVIQWTKKHDAYLAGVPYNFQLIMEETTGKVYYQYDNVIVGSTTYNYGASATIGLAGGQQDFALSYNNASFLQSNSCVEFYYTNCPKPENLVLQYVTPDEAAFSWTAGLFGETNWTVVYGPAGFDPSTGGTSLSVGPSPTVTLVNLNQLTCYDVYVYSECSAGNTSFALVGNFCTLPLCANPTGLTGSTSIDSLFSTWSWSPYDPNYIATGFDLTYGTPGFDPATSGTSVIDNAVPGDTIFDINLLAGGVYELYVRGICDTLVSSFVGPITLTMPLTNDSVCGAELLPVNGLHNVFSNQGASTQTNESTIAPPVTGAQTTDGWLNNTLSYTTWFKFVAPASGSMRVDATDVIFNGQAAVYEIVSCNDFNSFTLLAANDDEIDGFSQGPNFTICGLTPGAEYYLMHDSYSTSQTGTYSLRLSAINLDAGVSNSTVSICSKDTINLFDGISAYQAGGVWNDIDFTYHIVNDSLFNTSGLAYQVYNFEYRLTDGCATDAVVASYQVYPPSTAGTDGSLTICKNEPFSLMTALGGTIQSGGQWYDYQPNPINSANVPMGTLANPGNYNYNYIVGNGVCPDDTSIVTVAVLSNCDFTGIEENSTTSFNLYPNPTSNEVNLIFTPVSETTTFELLDVNGKILATSSIESGQSTHTMNVSTYEPGVYLIRMSNENSSNTQRVVVQ